jgi:AcrR family transcriptional regulator
VARIDVAGIRRDQIIDAALDVFGEKGYHNTGIGDIAAELDVGRGTLYRYFKNKLEIATSVINSIIKRIAEVLTLEPPQGVSTIDQYRQTLANIGDRFIALIEDNREVKHFLWYETLFIDEAITRKINEFFELMASYTEMYLRNGIEKGFLNPEIHTRETAYAINGMLFEAARRLSAAPEFDDELKEAWRETIMDMVLNGLAVRT